MPIEAHAAGNLHVLVGEAISLRCLHTLTVLFGDWARSFCESPPGSRTAGYPWRVCLPIDPNCGQIGEPLGFNGLKCVAHKICPSTMPSRPACMLHAHAGSETLQLIMLLPPISVYNSSMYRRLLFKISIPPLSEIYLSSAASEAVCSLLLHTASFSVAVSCQACSKSFMLLALQRASRAATMSHPLAAHTALPLTYTATPGRPLSMPSPRPSASRSVTAAAWAGPAASTGKRSRLDAPSIHLSTEKTYKRMHIFEEVTAEKHQK